MSRRKILYRRRHGAIPESKRTEYADKLVDAHGAARDDKGNVCSRPMRLETAQRIAGCVPVVPKNVGVGGGVRETGDQ